MAGKVASRVLSKDFDQTGSDFIDMGIFHLALDTLDLALGGATSTGRACDRSPEFAKTMRGTERFLTFVTGTDPRRPDSEVVMVGATAWMPTEKGGASHRRGGSRDGCFQGIKLRSLSSA